MKIGLDFDDVTVDFFNSLLVWHNKKYNRNDKREQFKEFHWYPVWNVSKEEGTRRVDEFHETHNVKDIFPMKDAIDSINFLLKENELVVITGRPIRFKNRVEEWLLHHLKRKLEVIHAGEFYKGQAASKAEICKSLGIKILFEDAPETALDCANSGIKVILFSNSWNQNIKHPNIHRVKEWKGAIKVLNILKLSKYMKIEKKIWPEYFNKVLTGEKTYELRVADFECKEGDILVLREWNPETKSYTGRVIEKKVTFVIKTKELNLFPKEDVEKYGYQIISIK